MFYIRNNIFIFLKSPRPAINSIKHIEIVCINITFENKLQMTTLCT